MSQISSNSHTTSTAAGSVKKALQRGPYILAKTNKLIEAKKKIADYIAVNLVYDFDAVLLDAGSTAEVIAQQLFTRHKFLTVMTNNMGAYVSYTQAVASRLDKKKDRVEKGKEVPQLVAGLLNENELILTGGRFDVTYEALFGDATMKAIERFSPNVTIIGVSGLMFDGGAFCHGSEEVRLKNLLWEVPTDKRVIACDWTKIGKRDAFAFGPKIIEIKKAAGKAIVVTSRPPRDDKVNSLFDNEIRRLKEHDIEVHIEELD